MGYKLTNCPKRLVVLSIWPLCERIKFCFGVSFLQLTLFLFTFLMVVEISMLCCMKKIPWIKTRKNEALQTFSFISNRNGFICVWRRVGSCWVWEDESCQVHWHWKIKTEILNEFMAFHFWCDHSTELQCLRFFFNWGWDLLWFSGISDNLFFCLQILWISFFNWLLLSVWVWEEGWW